MHVLPMHRGCPLRLVQCHQSNAHRMLVNSRTQQTSELALESGYFLVARLCPPHCRCRGREELGHEALGLSELCGVAE